MATIASAKEQQQMFDQLGTVSGDRWIGLTDEVQEGTFKWVTGEPVNYTNWNPGSPDNAGGGAGQDYAYIINGSTTWDDDGTGTRGGYVMESGVQVSFDIDGDGSTYTFNGDVLPSVATGTIGTTTDAASALTEIKSAIESIAKQRADTGAGLRRLGYHLDEASMTTQNLNSSVSRIQDTDFAEESTKFARQSILIQSGTAMLAQANTLPQAALRLLG